MEDIETDCEGYGNHRSNRKGPLSPDPRNTSLKFPSIEERNDSGLGSLGYFSQEFNSGSLSLLEEELRGQKSEPSDTGIPLHPDKVNGSSSNSGTALSTDLANSLSRLNIGSFDNKVSEQCDSGLDDSVLAARAYLTQCANLHWVSPHFTPDQILEIFRGDEDGDK